MFKKIRSYFVYVKIFKQQVSFKKKLENSLLSLSEGTSHPRFLLDQAETTCKYLRIESGN